MKCNFTNRLYDYLNNETNEKNKKIIEEHLLGCSICKKELEILQSLKLKFKKNIKNPPSDILYKIKKQTRTNNLIDFILVHKKIFGFSATSILIIASIIFFNTFFSRQDFTINEFLNDIYNFNTFEENIIETVSTVSIFNND